MIMINTNGLITHFNTLDNIKKLDIFFLGIVEIVHEI